MTESTDTYANQSVTESSDTRTRCDETKIYYARVKLSDAVANQSRFFESAYDDDLKKIVMEVLQSEAPIRDDVLARQVAKAHGFARTGANIRKRIMDLLGDVVCTEESTGRFLWTSTEPPSVIEFRPAQSEEDRRSIDEIAIAELAGLIQSRSELLSEMDPPVAIARSLGLARLSQQARDRIEEAIQSARAIQGQGN